MTARMIVLYALLFFAILISGCRTRGTCLQQCIDLQERIGGRIVVYRRQGQLHAVLAHNGVFRDPAFRVTRKHMDGQYRFTIHDVERWGK